MLITPSFHPLFTAAAIFFFLLQPSPSTAKSTTFTFKYPIPDDKITQFNRDGSYIARGAIQVTSDVKGDSIVNLSGRATYKTRIQLRNGRKHASFNSTFVLNITPGNGVGGEGLAFILSDSYQAPPNSHGQWLGIVNATTNSTTANIVAVEFDTKQSFPQDIDSNHVGLDIGSVYSLKQVPLSNFGVNISSGKDINATIRYLAPSKTIQVYAYISEGTPSTTPVLTQDIDFYDHLPEYVYVGFSASTGEDTELNCVKSWEFSISDVADDKTLLLWLWVGIPVVAVVLFVGLLFFYMWRRRMKRKPMVEEGEEIEREIQNSARAPKRYTLKELKACTGNFSEGNALGKGGFGTVYRGVIEEGKVVAVKRFTRHTAQGKQDFVAEVTTIGNLNHKNLVKLQGWCNEGGELLLVYEFMEKGSLDAYIFKGGREEGQEEELLKWEGRVSVIRDVAGSLEYLHNGSEKRVLHRDVKASNILLDREFGARLGDFGLARTVEEKTYHSTKEIAGTPGYMAPESFHVGRATAEGDVYGFGVLVLEVVCGRRPGRQMELNGYSNGIVDWVWGCYNGGEVGAAADQRLGGGGGEVEKMLLLGLACCHPNPYERPSMRTVVQVLEGVETPPTLPLKKPVFMWPPPISFSPEEDSPAVEELDNCDASTVLSGR